MTGSPEATALAYLDAVASKDLDRLNALLHPEVRFVSPASNLSTPKELLPAFRRIGAVHVRSDVKRVFSDGNEVCVIYDFVTDVVGAVKTVEWLRIENGRIRSIDLYYDQVPWIRLREEMQRRSMQARA